MEPIRKDLKIFFWKEEKILQNSIFLHFYDEIKLIVIYHTIIDNKTSKRDYKIKKLEVAFDDIFKTKDEILNIEKK
jgi:hypothetical protein